MLNRNVSPFAAEEINLRRQAEESFARRITKSGKLLDEGFPSVEPTCIDLKLQGKYEGCTVEYVAYKQVITFQGAGLYERNFELIPFLLTKCKVEVKGKRVYITDCNGKRFYKLASNKTLKVHFDRHFISRPSLI